VCGCAMLVVWPLRHVLASWLFAAEYHEAADLMGLLAVAFTLQSFSQLFNTVSLAHRQPRRVLLSESMAAAMTLLSGVPLIYWWGIYGAAFTTCLSYLVELVTAYWLSRPLRRSLLATGN